MTTITTDEEDNFMIDATMDEPDEMETDEKKTGAKPAQKTPGRLSLARRSFKRKVGDDLRGVGLIQPQHL